ncbi:MAG: HD domain-containing phosphohydrolase [Acidimicrobiales bacterium]
MSERLRLAELLAGLSMVSDLGYELPVDTAVRSCVMGTSLARRMALSEAEIGDVFFVSLLFHVGCVAYSHETTELFGDDLAVNHAVIKTDITDLRDIFATLIPESSRGLPATTRLKHAATMVMRGQAFGRAHNQASCEVARDMARRIGLPGSVSDGLYDMHEWWNGRGARGVRGEAIARSGRIARVATEAVELVSLGAPDQVADALRRRAGTTLDPEVVECLSRDVTELVEEATASDPTATVLEIEPGPVIEVSPTELSSIAHAFGDMADLKNPFTHGHSQEVARLAVGAAERLGLERDMISRLEVAACLHDLGRIGVPNRVWSKPGPLTTGEWEQVRLHSYHSERILASTLALAPMAPLVGMHHERLDGSGYHRACRAGDIGVAARVLATADAYQAMTQHRPHREALAPGDAADELLGEVRAGRFDPAVAAAVLDAAGQDHAPPHRNTRPGGLSDREIEVLGLVTQGLSNPQIGRRLGISRRTAEHHVQHIYTKIGVSTRAAAALFALEHELLLRP